MGKITWTPDSPDEPLGVTPVYENFSFEIKAQWKPDPGTETLDNITVDILSENISQYLTVEKVNNTVLITGNVPLDVFDQYSITYVEQGSSNLIQTPVVSLIADVPDNKEVYIVTVDPRQKITIDLLVTCHISDGTTISKPFTIDITQTYTMVRNWIDNYFKNRY